MYPKGYAPQKPQQTIPDTEFDALVLRGDVLITRKYNGNRCHILTGPEGQIRIYSRNGTLDWTPFLPQTIADLRKLNLPAHSMIDAELYVPQQENVEAVQEIINSGEEAKGIAAEARLKPKLAVFDMLMDSGKPIHSKPMSYRWARLQELLTDRTRAHPVAEVAVHTYAEALAYIEANGIEGLVIADMRAPHSLNTAGNTKRGASWKVKIRVTEDLVASGSQPCADPKLGVGTLVLNRQEDGKLKKAGTVGSFELTFDRVHALTDKYPYVVEVIHFGCDDRGNMEFPKILRKRPDLAPDFGL